RGSDTDYFANSLLGVRFGGEWESQNGAWNLRPRAQMGWQHRYGSVDNDYQAQFQGAPVAFTSSGTDTARDTFVGTVGMEFLSLENGMRLYADYGFGLSSKHDEHTFGAGVSIPW
nr:autotransporter outer membrane beta-barrel domain-containing protein [Verrucomicrobiales bacterium]